MRKHAWLLPLLFGLAFTSCAVGPKYRARTPEQMNVPGAWHAAPPEGAHAGELSEWWTTLDAPLLTELVGEAMRNSPTMELAGARLRESRAQRKVPRPTSSPR
jgi:multidrug efflux system outer membrane protein